MRFLNITALAVLGQISLLVAKSDMLVPVTPALSPDGSQIVFGWNADLWMASIHGGEARRLTTHPGQEIYPLYSRDGKNLYFNSNRSGSLQVWKLDLEEGGKATQITRHSEITLLEDISPDDRRLIVRGLRSDSGPSAMRFFYQDIKGEKAERMLFNAYGDDPRISPDGSKVLFTREGTGTYRKGYVGSQAMQIWLYDKSTNQFSQPVESVRGVGSPMWLPDGSGFYYVNSESGTANLHRFIFATNTDTALTDFEDDGLIAPTISRDGSTILFRKLFHYYTYNTKAGGEPKQLDLYHTEDLAIQRQKDLKISTTDDVDFSSSGLEIIFEANGDIFAMDTVLREPNPITMTFARESNLFFSPDSKAIYFIEDDGITTRLCSITKSNSDRYWWDADSFAKKVIIDTQETIQAFKPSPNGKFIAYTTATGRLWITTVSGQSPRVLVSSWDSPAFEWSPDSEWITYAVSNDNFNSDVFVVRVDGSEDPVNVSQHPDNDFAPTFSPDGKKIAFVGRRFGTKYDLYFVDLTTIGSGKSARLKKLEDARKAMKKDPAYKTSPKAKANPGPDPKVQDPKRPKPDPSIDPKDPSPPPVDPTKIDPNNQPDPKKIPTNPPPKKEPAPQKSPDPKQDQAKSGGSDQPQNTNPQDPEPVNSSTKPSAPKKREKSENSYDLEHVQKRIQRIQMRFGNPTSLIWSHDSKSIIFQTGTSKSTYIVEAKAGAKPKEWSKVKGTPVRSGGKDKLYAIVGGTPAILSPGGASKYPFITYASQSRIDHQRMVFRRIWRTMRDGFYDEHLNGKNWPGMLTKYEHAAATAPRMKAFDRIIAMLLGELNASHTGFRSQPWQTPWKKQVAYRTEVAHLGVIYDSNHSGKGWKIKEVLPTGPADKLRSKLEPGEIILEINGTSLTPETPESDVLLGRITDEITLVVADNNGATRMVKIQPISYSAARNLVNEASVDKTRQHIEKISDGRLGYIHIARMMWDEFEQFERHLYENGAGKDGIVIDVRDNGGGYTTDHLLTVLTQPSHAYTIPRNGGPGYPQDRFVYATWDKPIIVLCNQNSFSNAEIFSHAIRTLNRGKVVGVPTAGGVISAGQVNILNAGNLRYPFRGWFIIDSGEDMELNGTQPHHIIWPKPAEIPNGIDRQADKAVEILLKEIKNNPRQFPEPRYRNRHKTSP